MLDLSGPAGVFSTATRLDPKARYQVVTASPQGGPVVHSCGLRLETVPLKALDLAKNDTVLVLGGYAHSLGFAMGNTVIRQTLMRASEQCERYGSICTGAFILGAAGLLDNKAAATHWAAQRQLQERFGAARIDPDKLYVTDGRLWTSAGVTTGIDMALAILEQDHGPGLKAKVARQLVVYTHRPGHQSQFSDILEAQTRSSAMFTELIDWLAERLNQPIRVEEMADKAGMSVRSFQRRFTAAFGIPPGKFHEQLRLDRARDLIEAGDQIKSVTAKVGFLSSAAFRSAFKDRFGITPRLCAQMAKSVAF